jgi:hypothetical protein
LPVISRQCRCAVRRRLIAASRRTVQRQRCWFGSPPRGLLLCARACNIGAVTETGSIELPAWHGVRVLSAPPRNPTLPAVRRLPPDRREFAGFRAGIRSLQTGNGVLGDRFGVFVLWPQNPVSWETETPLAETRLQWATTRYYSAMQLIALIASCRRRSGSRSPFIAAVCRCYASAGN